MTTATAILSREVHMAEAKPFLIEPVLVVSEPADDLQVEIIGGRVPFCRPADKPRSAGERFIIAIASLWISQGKTAQASLMLASLQRGLGVTPEDHIGAVELAFVRDRSDRAGRRPRLTEVLRVEMPDSERGRSPEDVARLEVLNARLSKPPKGRGRLSPERAREEDLRERDAIERRPAETADREWERQAAAETEALAQARGEDVEERTGTGRVVISSRDPLLSLLRAGHLKPEQYDTGVTIRDLYERRNEGVGSQIGAIGGGSSPTYDNSNAVFYGVQRAKALQRIGVIERAITIELTAEPVCLTVLRWVCEQGNAIRAMSSGSRSFERNAKALARALDVADAVIRGR